MVHHSLTTLTINPSPLFQIRLGEDTLTMRGSLSESVGCILRGQLVLALTEPIKIRQIRMVFQGKSKVGWIDGVGSGQHYHNEKRILYQHEWIFIEPEKNYHILSPANYSWDFELVLPGMLPETIEGCEHGQVRYKLKATAERHTFALNLHTQRPVRILRCPLPASIEFTQSMIIANTWEDKVDYEFVVASRAFTLGEKIPIEVTLKPLQKGLYVYRFSCILKEYITYHVGAHTREESSIVCIGRDDQFPTDGTEWTIIERLPIPERRVYCHYDTENDIIRIRHKLKLNILFGNKADNHFSELCASVAVTILPLSMNGESMTLPAYDSQCLATSLSGEDCLPQYLQSEPAQQLQSSQSLTSSPSSTSVKSRNRASISSIHSSSSEGCKETATSSEGNFNYTDLMRLPSYRSISLLTPAPAFDSLPPKYYSAVIN